MYQDRFGKLQEHLRQLALLFRKLRLLYERCVEMTTDLQEGPAEVCNHVEGRFKMSAASDKQAFKSAPRPTFAVLPSKGFTDRKMTYPVRVCFLPSASALRRGGADLCPGGALQSCRRQGEKGSFRGV